MVSVPLVPENLHHKALDIDLPLGLPVTLKNNPLSRKMFFLTDFDAISHGLNAVDWDNVFLLHV